MKTTITLGIALLTLALIFFNTTNSVAQSLVSDRSEYSPGTIANLTGSGFTSLENVTLLVADTTGTSESDAQWIVQADTEGNFITSYSIPVGDATLDPTLRASADGQSSGEHAEATFKGSDNGTGVVTITSNGGCLGFTAAQGAGPDNWEVAEGGSYHFKIDGVTECEGDAITVFVQNSSSGNWCFTATGGNGTYEADFTMPSPTCNTSPISYKCGGDQDCSNANAYNANGQSNTGKVHFRASIFNSDCVKTGDDTNCNSECHCTVPANITVTGLENDQVQVCWDAQDCATGYILQFQWKGHSEWFTVDVNSPDHCGTFSLTGHQNIYIRVATVCSTGDTTEYSQTIAYKYSTCTPPSGLSTTDVTGTSATFNWTPGTASTGQRVRYQELHTTNAIVKTLSTSATSYTATGLNPSTSYKWKVKGDCWSPYLKFTTASQKVGEFSSTNGFSVYPNPASDRLSININMDGSESQPVVLQIVNMMGQIVYTENTAVNGNTTLNLNINHQFADGVYTVRVLSNSQSMEQKVIISNDK